MIVNTVQDKVTEVEESHRFIITNDWMQRKHSEWGGNPVRVLNLSAVRYLQRCT